MDTLTPENSEALRALFENLFRSYEGLTIELDHLAKVIREARLSVHKQDKARVKELKEHMQQIGELAVIIVEHQWPALSDAGWKIACAIDEVTDNVNPVALSFVDPAQLVPARQLSLTPHWARLHHRFGTLGRFLDALRETPVIVIERLKKPHTRAESNEAINDTDRACHDAQTWTARLRSAITNFCDGWGILCRIAVPEDAADEDTESEGDSEGAAHDDDGEEIDGEDD